MYISFGDLKNQRVNHKTSMINYIISDLIYRGKFMYKLKIRSKKVSTKHLNILRDLFTFILHIHTVCE